MGIHPVNITPKEEYVPLTPTAFYVLLALAKKPMYGYGVVEQIHEDTEGLMSFERAPVYRAIQRLTKLGLLEPSHELPSQGSPHDRRYHQLTSAGRTVLEWESNRYRAAAILGKMRLAQ